MSLSSQENEDLKAKRLPANKSAPEAVDSHRFDRAMARKRALDLEHSPDRSLSKLRATGSEHADSGTGATNQDLDAIAADHTSEHQEGTPSQEGWQGQSEGILLASGAGFLKHNAMKDSSRQIRLLRFLPGDNEEVTTLSFSTSIWDLDDPPNYIAISYTWGEKVLEQILIDGEACLVRHNCRYALEQVRQYWPRTYIWIDAICINQLDLPEKGAQVNMMFDIYKQAMRVAVCLGPHENDSEWLMVMAQLLKKLFNPLRLMYEISWSDTAGHNDERVEANDLWARLGAALGGTTMERLANAFVAFANRRYWLRAWIIQEFAAFKSAGRFNVILCGSSHMSASSLLVLNYLLSTVNRSHWSAYARHARIGWQGDEDAMSMVLCADVSAFENLHNTLRRSRLFQCTDPRDRLYSQLSLIDWKNHVPIRSDYTNSAWDLALLTADVAGCMMIPLILGAFRISHTDVEFQKEIKSRRDIPDVPFPQPPSLARAPVSCMDPTKSRIVCVILKAIAGQGLTAAVSRSSNVPSILLNNIHDARVMVRQALGYDGGFVPVWSAARSSSTGTRELAALLHCNAMEHDLIINVGSIQHNNLLVLRKSRHTQDHFTYDVIGQGILVNWHLIAGSTFTGQTDALDLRRCVCGIKLIGTGSAHVDGKFRRTVQDAITVEAQDLKSRADGQDVSTVDHEARLLRLVTRPMTDPIGAVELRLCGSSSSEATNGHYQGSTNDTYSRSPSRARDVTDQEEAMDVTDDESEDNAVASGGRLPNRWIAYQTELKARLPSCESSGSSSVCFGDDVSSSEASEEE